MESAVIPPLFTKPARKLPQSIGRERAGAGHGTMAARHAKATRREEPEPLPPSEKNPYLGTPRGAAVNAQELQAAVLVVLALYASLALLDFRSEFSDLAQHWHTFVEFLAHLVF